MPTPPQADTYVDVLIIGAGLSGIGAAVHLQKRCPDMSYAILEARPAIGGTWDLFRYPGIRSDSDMFTLGYAFKPWREQKAIADGPSILRYVRETAQEHGVAPHIRFNTKVLSASWNSAQARWTVQAETEGRPFVLTCGFLWSCAGYYRYDQGHAPHFEGQDSFAGALVHPQHWPADLDYTGKRVVVIGSGATAVTLVPAMADRAAHVTMLQRSPSYLFALPAEDKLANTTRKVLPEKWAYGLTRWRKILVQRFGYVLARKHPAKFKQALIEQVRARLGPDYPVDKHFTPRYNPWDQRICAVPDDDIFNAIKSGKASVVTDEIDRFTPTGIRLKSGEDLPADIIVTATGLALEIVGGASLAVDGRPVNLGDSFSYKGMMASNVPNFASVFGYTAASWTLRADLVSEYICRLLRHMRKTGAAIAVPRQTDPAMPASPYLDFSSGYVTRAIEKFPKQGPASPWRHPQDYIIDLFELRYGRLDDGFLQISPAPAAADSKPAHPALAAE